MDGVQHLFCTIYVYYVTSNILDPNAPLSLVRVLACYDLLQKQSKNDKRTTKIGTVGWGNSGNVCWLLVSEGEFPVVDSLCNGDVDKVVQYDRMGNCLLCFVPTYLTERPSSTHFLLPLSPPIRLHLTNLPPVLR